VVAYVLFTSHQLVATPWAVVRYVRSVLTGQVEWLKTDHGVPRPAVDLAATLVADLPRDGQLARVQEWWAMDPLQRSMR
jgi:hypothetical protein